MPVTTHDLERSARIFHALADPIRLEIVEHLSDGEQCVCNLTEALDTSQSLLSFHLKTLKDAGIVIDRREGRWNYYALNEEVLAEAREVLATLHIKPRPSHSKSKACD